MTLPLPSPPPLPTIETPRLSLRALALSDFEDVAAMGADPAVMKFIGGPQRPEEAWDRFLRAAGCWAMLGHGTFAVRERETGRFVGEVGHFNRRRQIEPSFGGAPEAGWVLAAWSHGKGYASEAVQAATAWLEGRFGPVRTVCMIDVGHAASIRVAEKCGHRRWAETVYQGKPVLLFERPPGGR
jgi:RimJ/RimL family protein N-acetyltransferase